MQSMGINHRGQGHPPPDLEQPAALDVPVFPSKRLIHFVSNNWCVLYSMLQVIQFTFAGYLHQPKSMSTLDSAVSYWDGMSSSQISELARFFRFYRICSWPSYGSAQTSKHSNGRYFVHNLDLIVGVLGRCCGSVR